MRRVLATAALLAALIAPAAATPASGAGCVKQVAWHTTRYKQVATTARVPLGRRLGRGAIIACSTTSAGGGYGGRARAVVRQSVYAVPGVRPQVAVALRAAHPALFVSNATATAAERRVLNRLRGR
jgi:uncharacterized protein DUF6281